MANKAKHREISRQLRAAIAGGRYGAKGRLPGEPQLVKQFGVSRPTVARALLDLQAEGLIERRAGSGTYVRAKAPSLAGTRQLGLLVPGLENTEIFGLICGELAGLAQAQDYSLLWGSSMFPHRDTDSSREHAEAICQQFIERRVTGVFFAPFELVEDRDQTNQHLAELLREAGIPVVLLDRDLRPFPNRSDFDLVGIDNMAAGFLLADHLLRLGCERLFFLARPLSAPTVDARIAGAREALVRRRIELAPDWVRLGDPADLKLVRAITAGKQADAFICANDHTAAVLIRSLESIGVRVPRDVRVVGFDDVKYATLLSVPLTTIHQPCRDIAVIAFRAMLQRIAEPTLPTRSLALTPALVVRESCGAYLPQKGSPPRTTAAR